MINWFLRQVRAVDNWYHYLVEWKKWLICLLILVASILTPYGLIMIIAFILIRMYGSYKRGQYYG